MGFPPRTAEAFLFSYFPSTTIGESTGKICYSIVWDVLGQSLAMTWVVVPYTAWNIYQSIKESMELFRVQSAKRKIRK